MSRKRTTLSSVIFKNFEAPPWPSFVKPMVGEIFSSWLLRMSRSHLVRYYTFCSSYFEGIEFWDRDLDKFLPDGIKKIIGDKSILESSEIESMMLSSFNPNLFTSELSGRNFWFTPFSVYSTRYTAKHPTTISICPSCLRNDGPIPYYRKSWRLSIQTICVNCETNLIDRCPNCKKWINHLISEKEKRSQIPIFPITCCWSCLYDLRNSECTKAAPELLDMQGYLNELIESGYDIAHSLQYSHLYFLVLRKIISLLNKQGHQTLEDFQKFICSETGLKFIPPASGRKHPYELLPIEDRRNLLYKSYWVLADWPYRFREITAKAGLRSKVFSNDFSDMPYWFLEELVNNKVVYSEWRRQFSGFSYSSFSEFAHWRVSKMIKAKDPNKKAGAV